MKKKKICFLSLRIFIYFFFLSPFIYLLFRFGFDFSVFNLELFRVLQLTFEQAALSTIITLLLGTVAAFGLLEMSHNSSVYKVASMTLWLPALLPSLLVVMSYLKVFSWMAVVPFSWRTVVLMHTLINCGLVTVSMERGLREKTYQLNEAAYVMGLSFFQFWKNMVRIIFEQWKSIGMFIFLICFSSFSIPLLVGGQQASSLEVFIFQKIKIDGDWRGAASLNLIQMTIALLLGFRPFALGIKEEVSHSEHKYFYGKKYLLYPILLLSSLWLFGQGIHFLSLEKLLSNSDFVAELGAGALQTFYLCLMTGLFFTAFFVLVTLFFHKNLHRFLRGFSSPSAVALGFVALLASIHFLKITAVLAGLVLALLFFPGIYRLYLGDIILNAESHWEVCRVMGGSRWFYFHKIFWVAHKQTFLKALALLLLWASGEFAVVSIIYDRTLPLSLLAKNYIAHYQSDLSLSVTWLALGVGAISYFVFKGIFYVAHKVS